MYLGRSYIEMCISFGCIIEDKLLEGRFSDRFGYGNSKEEFIDFMKPHNEIYTNFPLKLYVIFSKTFTE